MPPGSASGRDRIARQQHEARGVVARILDIAFDDLQPVEVGRQCRGQRAKRAVAALRHERRRASGVGMAERHDPALAQITPRLAERLRMAVGRLELRPGTGQRHQRVMDRHEMLGNDRKAAFGQQEVNVGHPAGLAVLDRDDRRGRAFGLDRVQRVLEAEAGQRQRIGRELARGLVAVGARRAGESQRARRFGLGGGAHLVDQREGGGGEASHDARGPALRLRDVQ